MIIKITTQILKILKMNKSYTNSKIYGNGHSAKNIVNVIKTIFTRDGI